MEKELVHKVEGVAHIDAIRPVSLAIPEASTHVPPEALESTPVETPPAPTDTARLGNAGTAASQAAVQVAVMEAILVAEQEAKEEGREISDQTALEAKSFESLVQKLLPKESHKGKEK